MVPNGLEEWLSLSFHQCGLALLEPVQYGIHLVNFRLLTSENGPAELDNLRVL